MDTLKNSFGNNKIHPSNKTFIILLIEFLRFPTGESFKTIPERYDLNFHYLYLQ